MGSNPVTFKTIHERLHSRPCHYKNYDEFNEDVHRIFYQEKRLKSYKGANSEDLVKKRILNAKRVENYWNTLTASYKEYGFEAVNEGKKSDSDDSKEGDIYDQNKKRKKKKKSKKQKKNQKVLSNIKKRVKRGDDTNINIDTLQSPKKRRKLNDNNAEVISSNLGNTNNSNNRLVEYMDDDEEDSKKAMDESMDTPETPKKSGSIERFLGGQHREESENLDVDERNDDLYGNMRDSPFTPFAEKSRIFTEMMGNTEDLFKNLQHPMSDKRGKVKKRLEFEGNDNDYLFKREPMHTFEIKWRYDDDFHHKEPRYIDIEETKMDLAVHRFNARYSHSKTKVLTVKLRRLG